MLLLIDATVFFALRADVLNYVSFVIFMTFLWDVYYAAFSVSFSFHLSYLVCTYYCCSVFI